MGLALKKEEKYTYQDYLRWDDNERWELIDGIAYNMSPAPGTRHQIITARIYSQLEFSFRGKITGCMIFIAPTDVVLSEYDV
ncbi:MAG: Uma2 family endonuclease, partial [Thermodesulfovibrionales bacterium]|nr:Uma2 family endonuclease [Thermodesulfovibrionales bacterium]